MGVPGSDLQHLLQLALDRSVAGRRALSAALGDMFCDEASVLTERERALMVDILRKLIRECEMAVRRDLGERLARSPDTPSDLILALANDEIEVAEPILMASGVLRDMELVQIIRHRSQQHQLAIAMRRSLSETVSDALVETQDENVIQALLENQDAKIAEATMAYLVEESRRLDRFQEPLVKRRDLKPELAARLRHWVSAALRRYILDHFDIAADALDDSLEPVAVHAPATDDAQTGDGESADAAGVLAGRLARGQRVSWDFLIQVLRRGEVSLFEALFARLAGLSDQRLRHILYDAGGESLAILSRALEMPKPSFATIFLLSRKGRPGGEATDPRVMSKALMLFDRVHPPVARRVVKSWQRAEPYQEAVERVAMGAEDGPHD